MAQREEGDRERGRESGGHGAGSLTADFGQGGDWGRQGSWGTYGNRPSFERREEGGAFGGYHGGSGGGPGPYSGAYGEPGRNAARAARNWQRSDERIREDICDRLADHPHLDAAGIAVEVKNGEATITWPVEDGRMKRVVEDLVEGVCGVKEVHNQLRAADETPAG